MFNDDNSYAIFKALCYINLQITCSLYKTLSNLYKVQHLYSSMKTFAKILCELSDDNHSLNYFIIY